MLTKDHVYYHLIAGAKFGERYEFVRYTHTLNGRVYGFKCSPMGTRNPDALTSALPSEVADALRPITPEVLAQYIAECDAAKAYKVIQRAARDMAFIAENIENVCYIKGVVREISEMQFSLNLAVQQTHAALPQTRPPKRPKADSRKDITQI